MILDINFQFGQFYNSSSGMDWGKIFQVIVAIIAAYIAWRAYLKADVRKVFAKYQIDTVLELLSKMEKTHLIFITPLDSEPNAISGFHVPTINHILSQNRPFFTTTPVYIEATTLDNLEFLKYVRHLYLPKPIADELAKFYCGQGSLPVTLPTVGDYVVITAIPSPPTSEDVSSGASTYTTVYQTCVSPTYYNVRAFLNQILKVKEVTVKWMKDKDIDVKNLNLRD